MSHLNPAEKLSTIQESKAFYDKNLTAHICFYRPLNEMFPFLFRSKVKYFRKQVQPYLDYCKSQSKILRNQIIQAYATKNYTQNHFGHFIFNIDGKSHLYSIVELDEAGILDDVDKIINSPKKEKAQVIQLFPARA